MPVSHLSERLSKIIFLSSLPRESWKSLPTENNSRVNNKSAFIAEQLKGEGQSERSSTVPRIPRKKFLPRMFKDVPSSISNPLSGKEMPLLPSLQAPPVSIPEDRAAGRLKLSRSKYSTQVSTFIGATGSQPSHERNVAGLGGSK